MIVPPIAMLHHVEDRADWASLSPYCIQRKTFCLLLDHIERMGKNGVSLATALAKPDRKNVVLTFDDGAQHLWDYAIPELLKRGMTASFFIPTNHMGQTNSWDVAEGRAEIQLMDDTAIRDLKVAGMEVGGHSHQHLRLGDIEKDQVLHELTTSKAILDDLLSEDVRSMAWPYGSVPSGAPELMQKTGWKTGLAIFSPDSNPTRLRRFIVHDGDTPRSIRLKCGPLYKAYRSAMDRRKTKGSSQN